MSKAQKYWNPVLETLPREKMRNLQLKKFQKIFKWAYDNSKFHCSLYESAGMKPEDIQSFNDIRQVPKVEKSMMRDIQRKDPFPYGDALCVPLEEVSEYRQTSGTTGQPVYQADTWQDWEWWAESWAFILWAQGYRPSDRVFLPFGYNVFVAFWAGHYAAEKIGDCGWRSFSTKPTVIVKNREIGERVKGLDPISTQQLNINSLLPGDIIRLVGYDSNPKEPPIGKISEKPV